VHDATEPRRGELGNGAGLVDREQRLVLDPSSEATAAVSRGGDKRSAAGERLGHRLPGAAEVVVGVDEQPEREVFDPRIRRAGGRTPDERDRDGDAEGGQT
jgi:hypothetical protein